MDQETDTALPPVTDELLAALEFRYAVPRCCRVCGAPLAVADSKYMKMTCTSDAASPLASRYEPAGATWKEALDHYENSVMYNPPDGDRRVLALVAEIRRFRGQRGPLAASKDETGEQEQESHPIPFHPDVIYDPEHF